MERGEQGLVTDQDRADEAVVLDNQALPVHLIPLVDHDRVRDPSPELTVAAGDGHQVGIGLASRADGADHADDEAGQAGDVDRDATLIGRRLPDHVGAGHASLCERDRPECLDGSPPGDGIPRLCHVTCGINARDTRLHPVVDQDAAIGLYVRARNKVETRPDANGHPNDLAADLPSVRSFHAADPLAAQPIPPGCNARDLGVVVQADPFTDQPLLDQVRLGLVQHAAPIASAAHQIVHLYPARVQALDDLDRRDAATDDDGLAGSFGMPDHALHILHRVEG